MQNTLNSALESPQFEELNQFELKTIQGGGFLVAFLAIGAAAAAGVAIYEAGKAVGEFIYHVTNE